MIFLAIPVQSHQVKLIRPRKKRKLRMFINDTSPWLVGVCAVIATMRFVDCFTIASCLRGGFLNKHSQTNLSRRFGQSNDQLDIGLGEHGDDVSAELSRRKMMTKTGALVSFSFLPAAIGSPETSVAAVGTLPEFSDTNAIVNGITVNVADASQQRSMIDFLIGAFDFEVKRQRIQGSVEETVSIPQMPINRN